MSDQRTFALFEIQVGSKRFNPGDELTGLRQSQINWLTQRGLAGPRDKVSRSKPAGNGEADEFENPFEEIGIEDDIAKLLVAGGIENAEQLVDAVVEGRDLTELKGIGEAKRDVILAAVNKPGE
jgi:hypothetical protein